MQKLLTFVLAALLLLPVSGCAGSNPKPEAAPPITQIANPWKDWDSIPEAEQAVGFSFGLPEQIAQRYTVHTVRTMNNELLEVVYADGEFTVCVRKQKGEGQDISGDYNQYDNRTEIKQNDGTITTHSNSTNGAIKQIISYQGYSWSLAAPDGYGDTASDTFANLILK